MSTTWGAALCDCNRTLAWDAAAFRDTLGLDTTPEVFHRLPRDEIHRLIAVLAAGGFDRFLVGCCGPAGLFQEAAEAAGVTGRAVTVVDFRQRCFWPHADPAGANDAAARVARVAMQDAVSSRAPLTLPVAVSPSVLIATDSPAGIELARRLGDLARPTLLLDEGSAAFDPLPLHPMPWRPTWGRVAAIAGSLGAFKVTVERTQPIDLDRCTACRRCIPVCHTSAISDALRLDLARCDRCGDCLTACAEVGAIRIPRSGRDVVTASQVVVVTETDAPAAPRRTGHHWLVRPTPADLDAAALAVLRLVGEFQKPRPVTYDSLTCAGGAANHRACGRCIPACPYEAIDRDPRNPLRVSVDHAACEGCGACVAACPTSSLRFTDPATQPIVERLRALLSGGPPGARPVVAFHCPEKGGAALEHAARTRQGYPAGVLPVPVACLRHVSDADVLAAFGHGAAGVALLGCASCPHGEREGLLRSLDVAGTVLDAFGLGRDRMRLVAADGPDGLAPLADLAATVGPAPAHGHAGRVAGNDHREVIAESLRALIDATGREPGRTPVPAGAPFAFPDVQVTGCTVCRSCVNVCPTHAFRFREDTQTLELRQVACVNCGLCATACPESVITLRPETFLTRAALEWRPVVQDEPIRCLRCNTPFGNRRAVDVIERKVLAATGADAFAGARRNLLRMCPRCRAVEAVLEMQKGWEP